MNRDQPPHDGEALVLADVRPTRRQALLMTLASSIGCRRAGHTRDDGPRMVATSALAEPLKVEPSLEKVASEGDRGIDAAPYPSTTPREQLAHGALDLHDWSLPGDSRIARRAVVLVPRNLDRGERVPLSILLHGLAETADETMGAYAWVRRYGIVEGYSRLLDPASMADGSLRGRLPPERMAAIQADLTARPFRGLVVVCPYTPNFWRASLPGGPEAVLDRYAEWLFDVLLPRVWAETPVLRHPGALAVDGVSLGGYAALSVGIRRLPQLGAIGCVQAAISAGEAPNWAGRIANAFAKDGSRPLHLLTSDRDVFRGGVETLSGALRARSVEHTLRVAIGQHDQPFLRGPGSLEMLAWHHRVLTAGVGPGDAGAMERAGSRG